MNFIFEWQNNILQRAHFCHEKIKFISSNRRVMFFLLYRQKETDKIMIFIRQKVIVAAPIYSTAI